MDTERPDERRRTPAPPLPDDEFTAALDASLPERPQRPGRGNRTPRWGDRTGPAAPVHAVPTPSQRVNDMVEGLDLTEEDHQTMVNWWRERLLNGEEPPVETTKILALEARAKFLHLYSMLGSAKRSMEYLGRHPAGYYGWLNNPVFAALFDQARKLSQKAIEDELHRRAVEGWEEPVFQQGMRVGTITKRSDVLLMFLLKSIDRARYADYVDHRHLNLGNLNVQLNQGMDLSKLSLEELETYTALLEKAQGKVPQSLPEPSDPPVQQDVITFREGMRVEKVDDRGTGPA